MVSNFDLMKELAQGALIRTEGLPEYRTDEHQ